MKKMKNIGRSGKHEARSQAQTRPAVPIPIAIGTIGSNRGLYFVCPAVDANTEGENNEYRITNIESGSWKTEVGRQKSEDGRRKSEVRRQKTVPYFPSKGRTGLFLISRRKAGQAYSLFSCFGNREYRITNVKSGRNNQYSIINTQYPIMEQYSLDGSQKPAACRQQPAASDSKYKVAPLLPRGGFNSGDIPGAAAITIYHVLFSSPRVSPTQVAEFSTPHLTQCGVTNSTSRSACMCHAPSGFKPLSAYEPTGLPVINQTLHQGSFVPLDKGDGIRPLVVGSEGVTERRYAYVLN